MKLKYIALAAALLLAPACGASAAWLLGPSLSAGAEDSAFTTETIDRDTLHLKIPVYHGANLLTRARINGAIDVKTRSFEESLAKRNSTWKTEGWISWQEGMAGKDSPYTSFLLVTSTYPDRAAHPTSYAHTMTFDSLGHRVTIRDLEKQMPALTVEEVNRQIEIQCRERQIPIFEKYHTIRKLPDTFYIGKDGHLYLVFQQYEIAPYSSGFIAIDMGKI